MEPYTGQPVLARSRDTVNTMVIFENYATEWDSKLDTDLQDSVYHYVNDVNNFYDPHRFSMMIHGESNINAMRAHITRAKDRCIGYVYVTDDQLDDVTDPNPWNEQPTYWNAELDQIAAINSSANVWGHCGPAH